METFVGTLAVGVVIAVVSAHVTVRLALKRFRAEQWWTRKVDAYASLIEALHHLKRSNEYDMRTYERGRVSDKNMEARLKGAESYDAVLKAIDTAQFLLCEEAASILEKLRTNLENANKAEDYYEHLDISIDGIRTALGSLPKVARKDLRVER